MNSLIMLLGPVSIISLITNLLMVHISKKKRLFLDDVNKKHGSHSIPTPRIGGLGIYVSFGIGAFGLSFFLNIEEAFLLWISALPVFFVGFREDLSSDIPPKKRMFIMSLGVVLAVILLKTIVYNISVAELPLLLAIPFTIFAVVGVTNAINMVDGYNGLASGISLVALFFMLFLSLKLEDYELASIIAVLMASILGFFVLNFPWGKIFLGDSGAYTLGFMLGIISLLLLQRHPEISPWFPVVLLAYPIFDVLFAIFRRVFIQKTSPFSPDKLHMHSLVYNKLKNNPLTSFVIIVFSLPFSFISTYFFSEDLHLFLVFLLFSFVYLVVYITISNYHKLDKQGYYIQDTL